jgi:hypothetical protein
MEPGIYGLARDVGIVKLLYYHSDGSLTHGELTIPVPPVYAPDSDVVINEILPNPESIDWNGNGEFEEYNDEWIELYNKNSSYPANISNWKLSDHNNAYSIPASIIPPNGFISFFDTGLKLLNKGGWLNLTNSTGYEVDNVPIHPWPMMFLMEGIRMGLGHLIPLTLQPPQPQTLDLEAIRMLG